MGETPKPLNILVIGDLESWEEFKALEGQGHSVAYAEDRYDLILGGKCWRMTPDLRDYLDMAIKAARRVKYPKGGADVEGA